jgi:hypothetical protein
MESLKSFKLWVDVTFMKQEDLEQYVLQVSRMGNTYGCMGEESFQSNTAL